jgi:hypothetical protein
MTSPWRNWGDATATGTTPARREGVVVLFVVTIVYALVGLIAIWWSIFAGVQGLTMGLFVVFLIGGIVLAVLAQVLGARRRY